MKVGDRIRTVGFNEGLEGIVTQIREGFNSENHGTIEIKVEKIIVKKNFEWLNPGDLEHFSHFGWVKGGDALYTRGNVICVVVGSKLEGGVMENPRTFLRVITSERIGWINSKFCIEV